MYRFNRRDIFIFLIFIVTLGFFFPFCIFAFSTYMDDSLEKMKLSQFDNGTNTRLEESNKTNMILFTSWNDVSEKNLVHRNVVRTWRKWLPLIKPLFFYTNATGKRLTKEGWLVRPVSKTGCGKSNVPILRDMFMDAIKNYESVLYGYANGDITFDDGLKRAIDHLVNTDVVRDKPVLIIVRRTNVNFSNGPELDEHSDITEMYNNGKALMDGSSDGFFTNKMFPWMYVPDLVVGRPGIDMWLVAYARAMNVSVIDITKTVKAIHMTTKSGNIESQHVQNSTCNHIIFRHLHIMPKTWVCGDITCALLEVIQNKQRKTTIRKNSLVMRKGCTNCYMDLRKILPKSFEITGRTHLWQNTDHK